MQDTFRKTVTKLIEGSSCDPSMKKAAELMLDKLITLETRQNEIARGTHLAVGSR